MSMDVYLRNFLFGLLTASTWAGPLFTASPASLTPFLANKVPICAHPCLQSFVADSFPPSVCSSPSIGCLCTSDSETGYTIGEGALSCLASECPNWDQDEGVSAYDVCSNVEGSMPNTHTILTATHATSTTLSDASSTASSTSGTSHQSSSTSNPSRRSTVSSSSPASTSTSGFNTAATTVASSSSSSSSSTTQTSASSIAALPASALPSPSPTPVLTKPQVAGVVVASIGASALAFGLCFLLFCSRRKKHVRRHSGSSFGGDKVVGSTTDSTPDLAILAARDFGHDPEGKEVVAPERKQSPPQLTVMTPGSPSEGWSQWRRNTAPQDIGLALAPGVLTPGHPSPKTPASHRTRNSQLLPEKPSYSLFPPPLRPSPHSRRASQSLEAQLAARNSSTAKPTSPQMTSPRFPSTLDTSQSTMQGESNSRSSLPRPNIFPYMQAARRESNYKPYRKELPSDVKLDPQWSESTDALVHKPLPAHASPSARGIRLGRSIHERHPSKLRHRENPPPIVLKPLDTTSPSTPRRKKSDSRPPTWFSTGTETSFEDDTPDPVSALSPVKDRPFGPNNAGLPSNPRPRPQMPVRGDSLLARRRGDQKAVQAKENLTPLSVLQIVRHSAKQQILQSPVLSEPLVTDSASSNSPRMNRTPPRTNKGAGMTPPPSGWPGARS